VVFTTPASVFIFVLILTLVPFFVLTLVIAVVALSRCGGRREEAGCEDYCKEARQFLH
jgi:hypothetical protein